MTTQADKDAARKKSIQNSDPGKVLDLVISLTDEGCAQLQIKINTYMHRECDAELVLQIIVNEERQEAYIETVGDTELSRKRKLCISAVLADVLRTRLEVSEIIANFNTDFRTIISPYLVKDNPKSRIAVVPIMAKPFSVLVCVVAPKVLEEHAAILVRECFTFVWPTLQKSINLEYERTLKQKCQQLLRVARRLFTQVASLGTLLQLAMEQAKQLTHAEYCSVMLADVEKMELVERFFQGTKENQVESSERRFPMHKGIAGHVITTGSVVNAKVAPDHPSYDATIDSRPGIESKALLCFPIREQTGIIGVGQLLNKVGDPYFDAMDEEMALAFSIYCGLCIVHSVVHQKIQEAHIRNALANELVMYHMKVNDAEVSTMLDCRGHHGHPEASGLHFNSKELPIKELPCYVLRMFTNLGFDKRFNIRPQKLARFILQVKKGYRDVPYHSWMHSFAVTQWAFAALVNYRLLEQGYLTDLQGLMYLVASLVHDLDHRGTTNNFQIQGHTSLSALYSSEGSVMERHHLAQALCILNTQGCDILDSLPRRDYDRALLILRDDVLATDLANYFKNVREYRAVALDYQRGNPHHGTVLQALLMNAADLSDQIKDWSSVKKTATAVLTEFFRQGDAEKRRGDLPNVCMDRERCFIPGLEIDFLSNVCVPIFDILGRIIAPVSPCIAIIEKHIERWDAATPIFAEVPMVEGLSVLLSPELDKLIDLNIQEKVRQKMLAEQEVAEEVAA